MKRFWRFAVAIIGAALLTTSPAGAEKVQLSKRTAEKYRELKEHVTDANQRILIANVILGFIPFTPLLGGADPATTVEIATTDFAALGEASANINAIFRNQLKEFCQFEALAQHNSSADYRFWLDLADSFDGKKTFFPGVWENRQGPDVIRAVFSEPGGALALKVDGAFSGSSMSFPVADLQLLKERQPLIPARPLHPFALSGADPILTRLSAGVIAVAFDAKAVGVLLSTSRWVRL